MPQTNPMKLWPYRAAKRICKTVDRYMTDHNNPHAAIECVGLLADFQTDAENSFAYMDWSTMYSPESYQEICISHRLGMRLVRELHGHIFGLLFGVEMTFKRNPKWN